jgi:hypothetical protein
MRKLFLALFAAGGIASFSAPAAQAMPMAGGVFSGAVEKLTEDVRVYCHRTYTSRILHWGPCGYRRYYYRRPYYRRYYWRRRYWRHY